MVTRFCVIRQASRKHHGCHPLEAQISGDGSPLVVLHGLFGSARNWGGIARGLEDIRQTHALDQRNHGASPWSDEMTYPDMSEDVAAYILRRGLAPCDLLGHSMGGKTAMVLALSRPELIERLIIVDIPPAASAEGDHGDLIRAMPGLNLNRPLRRADADAELAPAIPDPTLRAFLLQNLITDGDRFRWRLNLAGIAANLPALIGFPDIDTPFPGPTTFLAGERSDYIRPRHEGRIRQLFPKARLVEIGETGHWPHAERPEKFLAMVRGALDESLL